MKYGTETTPRYEYDYNAKGQAARVTDNQLSRVTESEYDLADRPCRVTLRQNGSHMVTAEAAYDPVRGLLTKFTERIGTNYSRYETTYGYDSERRPTTISYGSTSDQTKYTYDALGRITKRIVKVGGYSYESTMSYLAGEYGDNSTTGLVSQISQTGRTHVYTYNDAGSIATDRYGGKTTRYTYDKIGQLVRVDDPHDTTVTDGTTWTYEYDRGGNLTKKKSYRHTTGDLDTSPESTISLAYGATAWKDKLTAYSGTAITYDAMGNPLSDGTWTYTWMNGRQLQGMTKTGTSASFLYNEEGLRVRKTVGSAVTHYFWHGDKVTYMVRGSEVLYFWYDGQGRPAVVAYNGTKYAYVYSLQGDVLGLINSGGTEVVGYNYNAWGETLSVTGTLAATLGNFQPFRYRGYIYDYETGLYYLRSRYYNPVWCRFINADENTFVLQTKSINSYTYCGSDPIDRLDFDGHEWWHWLIGAAIVVACAAAVVITAGGAAAGVAAVSTVVSGSVAGTVSTTVAASAFVGSAAVYSVAAFDAISSSSSIEDFAYKGKWELVYGTVSGGLIGAGLGLYNAKSYYNTHFYGNTSPDKLKSPPKNAYYIQWNSEGKGIKSYTRFDASGHQLWRIDYLGKAHHGIETPHLHIYSRGLYEGQGHMYVFSMKDVNFWRK